MEVIDAMNAGRPVLVAQSDVSAASELALDERFAFPAGDEHTLARRIDALIEQPEVRRAAGEVNQRLARRFPFEESAQKLMTTYRTAIAMKRASARSNKRLSQPTMNER
jgi:glycosyltransferase involved in cell wall biosynthesis